MVVLPAFSSASTTNSSTGTTQLPVYVGGPYIRGGRGTWNALYIPINTHMYIKIYIYIYIYVCINIYIHMSVY